MGWSWPYWVRGLIIGFAADILILIVVIFSPICSDFYRIGPAYPTDQPMCYWLVVNGRWIEITIAILIIGLLAGWLYGKIREKKQ